MRATLKYGLHWDAVISRWAREHANEVGALDVTKKSDILYIAVFIYFFYRTNGKVFQNKKATH